jgi:heterodisulfide reductase subunit C
MAVFNPSMLVAMMPKTGGLHLGYEKKPRNASGDQVIEVKISPDHLQACRDTGICVEGCPSREFLFVGHLLIRK